MQVMDVIGIMVGGCLLLGFSWAIIDLLIRIVRQPKREGPIDLLSLSPYPLVVQSENPPADQGPSGGPPRRMKLQPVRVRRDV